MNSDSTYLRIMFLVMGLALLISGGAIFYQAVIRLIDSHWDWQTILNQTTLFGLLFWTFGLLVAWGLLKSATSDGVRRDI